MSIKTKLYSLQIKHRWVIIYSLFILALLIAYKFNMEKTITVLNAYKQLKKQVEQNIQDSTYRQEAVIVEPAYTYNNNNFLADITEYSNEGNIIIREIAKIAVDDVDDLTIETNKIIVEGTYNDILSFIHYIEYRKRSAIINSATVEMIYNKASEHYYVAATLYIKSLANEKHT